MNVLFMGTPEFAAASLDKLYRDGFQICAVFTQPDKQRGRGMQVSYSPVKELAIKIGAPVFQPDSLRGEEVQNLIREFNPDIIAVVAYGKILPAEVISMAKYGAVNLHGSVLPKYRGAAPIQWAVLNGDSRTGVCTIFMNERMDAGDLIYSVETDIGETETSGELYDRLERLGADLLSKTLTDIEKGTAPRSPQNEDNATYVKRLDKSLSPIDWNRSPREVLKWIYGLQPWPVATTVLSGKEIRVFGAAYSERITREPPGSIVAAGPDGIVFACKDGRCLSVTELQLPGKKRMSAADFLRGHSVL